MGDVTEMRPQASSDAIALEVLEAHGIPELRRQLQVPEYLRDEEFTIAFRAMSLAGSLRVTAETEGRRTLWGYVTEAIADALTHESPEDRAVFWAEERVQMEAERRRDEIQPVSPNVSPRADAEPSDRLHERH